MAIFTACGDGGEDENILPPGTISSSSVVSSSSLDVSSSSTDGMMIVPGTGLAVKLQWLSDNAESDTEYLILVDEAEAIAPHTLSYSGKTGISITLKGTGAERTVSLTQNGTLFEIQAGVTLTLGENITLTGSGTNTSELVVVYNNGTLVMKDGAKITDNKRSGVYISGANALFIMDGGEITDNYHSTASSAHGGGVSIMYRGSFVMNGGLIARNTVDNSVCGGGGVSVYRTRDDGAIASFIMNGGEISDNITNGWSAYGGGVEIDGGTFTMNNGRISGNKMYHAYDGEISGEGGGVFTLDGTFTMTGGVIAGNSAGWGGGVNLQRSVFEKTAGGGVIYGSNGGENANTAWDQYNDDTGSAIYFYNNLHRETTVNADERLYAHVDYNTETYEGNWLEYYP